MPVTLRPTATALTLTVGLAAPLPSIADEVVFTAGVPNGVTAFPSTIRFGVGNDSNWSPDFELDLGAGVSGNGVVSSMEMDLENLSGFQGSVSGDMMTVANANQAWAQAPAEVDLSFSVDDNGGGVGPGVKLNLPFQIEPPDVDSSTGFVLVLVIGDQQGASVPAGAAGSIQVLLNIAGEPLSAEVDFDADTTTGEIGRALSALLDAAPLPSGIQRYHLEDAWPSAFVSTRPFDLSVDFEVDTGSGEQADFLLGAGAFAVPEPSGLGLLAAAGAPWLLRRRTADGGRG